MRAGKLTPGSKALAVAIMDHLASGGVIEFAEAGAEPVEKPALECFREFLAALPKAIEFGELSAASREAAKGRYRLIGKGSEWFAFKIIDRRPDFDHLVRLEVPARHGEVDVPVQGLARPDDSVRQAFKARGLTTIYFETDDLR